MGTIKFLTSVILIFFAFIFVGETYYSHVGAFENEYASTTFFADKKDAANDMMIDLTRAADEFDIKVFVVDRRYDSDLQSSINIYSTEGAEQIIRDRSDIESGTIHSMVLGNAKISYLPFDSIPDISQIHDYYLIGNFDSIIQFKENLVDKYGGSIPERGDSPSDAQRNIVLIWLMVFLLLTMLTLYQVALLKKETMIRLIAGQNIIGFICRHAAVDTLKTILVFIVALNISMRFTQSAYESATSYTMLLCFSVVNTCVYLWLIIADYKKDLGAHISEQKVLGISYAYKTVSLLIVIILMSGSLGLFYDSMRYHAQKQFFEEHAGYHYVMLSPKDFYDQESITSDSIYTLAVSLYNEYSNSGNAIALTAIESDSGEGYIYANHGSEKYLQSEIDELNIPLERKIYYLLPDTYSNDDEQLSECESIFEPYKPDNAESEYIFYNNSIDLVSLNILTDDKSNLNKNPAILFDNTIRDMNDPMDGYIYQSAVFFISDEEWNEFIRTHNLENEVAYRTNANEAYLERLVLYERSLYMSIFLLAILLATEMLIVGNLLRCEFNINAKEIMLKKIEGHLLLFRYGSLFRNVVVSTLIGILMAFTINIFQRYTSNTLIIIGSLLVTLIEICIIYIDTAKMERRHIQRVLKGG